MQTLSPRLGYYIISLGTVIQFLGLSSDSWLSDSSSNAGALSFSNPSDVMLILGMAITVLGVLLGFWSLAETMPNERDRAPRLLPALPLVMLVGLSIGSVAFAYQAGSDGSSAAVASESSGDPGAVPTPFVIAPEGPDNCPEGTLWHSVMGHCMTPEAIEQLENAQCPEGYALDMSLLTCVSLAGVPPGAPTAVSGSATPVCPIGFFWHPVMDHCMETSEVVCPAGYQWSTSQLSCTATSTGGTITTPPPNETPSCPPDTYWHPVMTHCMSNVCPAGFQYDYTYATCLQVAGPPPEGTPTPTSTPTPPGTTTTPEPTDTPTGTPFPSCPAGFFWHPAMGHCMSPDCPPGLVFDEETLFCVLPGETTEPEPTATPTGTPFPSCPDGFFWHPLMGHCMSPDCPPGLVFDAETLFCVLPSETTESTPTPTPTATPVPDDICPDGFYWNPAKGHCDSRECPPGLVFDSEALYCVFPSTPAPEPAATATPAPSCPDGYFWHPAMGHCMSPDCPPGLIFDPATLYCVLPP